LGVILGYLFYLLVLWQYHRNFGSHFTKQVIKAQSIFLGTSSRIRKQNKESGIEGYAIIL